MFHWRLESFIVAETKQRTFFYYARYLGIEAILFSYLLMSNGEHLQQLPFGTKKWPNLFSICYSKYHFIIFNGNMMI